MDDRTIHFPKKDIFVYRLEFRLGGSVQGNKLFKLYTNLLEEVGRVRQ